jgi:hypothetical protein
MPSGKGPEPAKSQQDKPDKAAIAAYSARKNNAKPIAE